LFSTSSKPIITGDPLIFISVAETSADLHGANLIRAVQRRCPTARFVGIAGPRTTAAGCHSVFDMTQHAGMLLGAVGAARHAIRMLRTAGSYLKRYSFDAAVVIDSPAVHLRLAGRAKSLGIPVLYYIAPQLWAWGSGRIRKMRKRVDRAAVILPFEEKYFRDRGVRADFVGHPLADLWAGQTVDSAAVKTIRALGEPVVAILPGSRKHVVEELLPGQLAVAEGIARAMPRAAFGVSVANAQVSSVVARALAGFRLEAQTYSSEHHAELIQAADLVLVASGTSTLEVAFHGRPMVVMYNASRVFYNLVGRWMIRTKFLSLPNILAGREIVPEFMPYYTSTQPITDCAVELLQSEAARQTMQQELAKIVDPLRELRASDQTAAILLDMAHRPG